MGNSTNLLIALPFLSQARGQTAQLQEKINIPHLQKAQLQEEINTTHLRTAQALPKVAGSTFSSPEPRVAAKFNWAPLLLPFLLNLTLMTIAKQRPKRNNPRKRAANSICLWRKLATAQAAVTMKGRACGNVQQNTFNLPQDRQKQNDNVVYVIICYLFVQYTRIGSFRGGQRGRKTYRT